MNAGEDIKKSVIMARIKTSLIKGYVLIIDKFVQFL